MGDFQSSAPILDALVGFQKQGSTSCGVPGHKSERGAPDGDARFAFDETRLTIDVTGLGITGYVAGDWLMEHRNISMGLSDERHILTCFTLGNDKATDTLTAGIQALAGWARREGQGKGPPPGLPPLRDLPTAMAMTPAEAFFGRAEAVPLDRAAGRIAAEMVVPYPPGIPRLVPGQRIEEAHVAYLRLGQQAGFFPAGLRDPDMTSLRVVS